MTKTSNFTDPVGVNDATLHYLDVIYRLTLDGDTANTTEIADKLRVTPSGASVMLKRLAERKLVQLTPYKGATLTPLGKPRSRSSATGFAALAAKAGVPSEKR